MASPNVLLPTFLRTVPDGTITGKHSKKLAAFKAELERASRRHDRDHSQNRAR